MKLFLIVCFCLLATVLATQTEYYPSYHAASQHYYPRRSYMTGRAARPATPFYPSFAQLSSSTRTHAVHRNVAATRHVMPTATRYHSNARVIRPLARNVNNAINRRSVRSYGRNGMSNRATPSPSFIQQLQYYHARPSTARTQPVRRMSNTYKPIARTTFAMPQSRLRASSRQRVPSRRVPSMAGAFLENGAQARVHSRSGMSAAQQQYSRAWQPDTREVARVPALSADSAADVANAVPLSSADIATDPVYNSNIAIGNDIAHVHTDIGSSIPNMMETNAHATTKTNTNSYAANRAQARRLHPEPVLPDLPPPPITVPL